MWHTQVMGSAHNMFGTTHAVVVRSQDSDVQTPGITFLPQCSPAKAWLVIYEEHL